MGSTSVTIDLRRKRPSELASYCELDPSQGQAVVERVLGRDFPGTVVSDDWCGYNVLRGKRRVCWIHVNRHLQAVEVAHGVRPRGPRDLSPPVYERRGHPPTTFLRFAHRLRALVREAVESSPKTPASALRAREKRARAHERRVRRLCEPSSKDEDMAPVSRDLLKRMSHLFEFVRDARIPWHNNAGERAIRSICVKRKTSGGDAERGGRSDLCSAEGRPRDCEAPGAGLPQNHCRRADPDLRGSAFEGRLNGANSYDLAVR